jgi:methionine-rich copper-binding protein CopC
MPLRPGREPDAGIVLPIRGALAPGAYTVEWRTMAGDGHPVSGRFGFSVRPPAR